VAREKLTGLDGSKTSRLLDKAVEQREAGTRALEVAVLHRALFSERLYVLWVNT
jgi:hypothetical protein